MPECSESVSFSSFSGLVSSSVSDPVSESESEIRPGMVNLLWLLGSSLCLFLDLSSALLFLVVSALCLLLNLSNVFLF